MKVLWWTTSKLIANIQSNSSKATQTFDINYTSPQFHNRLKMFFANTKASLCYSFFSLELFRISFQIRFNSCRCFFNFSNSIRLISQNVRFLLISHLIILIHQTPIPETERTFHNRLSSIALHLNYARYQHNVNIFCGFLRLSNFITKQIAFPKNKSRHQTYSKHSCFWIKILLLFFYPKKEISNHLYEMKRNWNWISFSG
jgi:hypothetical protein